MTRPGHFVGLEVENAVKKQRKHVKTLNIGRSLSRKNNSGNVYDVELLP